MLVLADFPWENAADWTGELRRQATMHQICVPAEIPDRASIDAAVVWKVPVGFFDGMTNLRAIIVPGAGVDQLTGSDAPFPDVPILRLADPIMATRMAEYILSMVLDHHRQLGRYRNQQHRMVWARHFHRDPADIRISILGMGVLGKKVAEYLRMIGYQVAGWSRTPKTLPGIDVVTGEPALLSLAERSDVLVCLLPLTPATRGLLDQRLFDRLPEDALLINAARGAHLVASDLLSALDRGKPAAAVLDVFDQEPLPSGSPLWRHPAVTVTPHIASLSNPITGVQQIVRALDKIDAGEPLEHVVDRRRGY
ncbi:MAG: glyoxylate/hydroxypyruvate reductase A [Pseudomonadota bacterium]